MDTLIINGKEHPYEGGMTVALVLGELVGVSGNVVVEINGTIIQREQYGQILVNAGDVLEIVHFVGGG